MSRSQIPRQLPPLQQKVVDQQIDMPFGEKKVEFADQYEQLEKEDEEEQEVQLSYYQQLQQPPNHDSGMTYSNFMNDDIVYNCFPFGDRISARISRLLHCDPPRMTLVDKLNKMELEQIINPFSLSEKDTKLIGQDKTMMIKIMGTSQLQMDTNIQHPFVKIHVVNIKNGCYIYKPREEISQGYANAVYNYETNCITNIVDGERERVTCELELLTAFSTNCCDMRMATNSRAKWNDEILINISADQFCKPDTLILFEILDFHPIYLQQRNTAMLDADNFYRIAWGYLRPNGLCKLHLGLSKVQLYHYCFDSKQLKSVSRRESIPLVYFDFLWLDKIEYDAVLNVYLGTQVKPEFIDIYGRNHSTSVYEIEKGDQDARSKVKHSQIIEKVIEQKVEELTELEKTNLRRRRYLGDKEDHVPDKIAYKFASAPFGCYRLAFNRYGNYLACACTFKNSKTIIKLFDVEQGIHFATYKGHRNIIHDLQFSSNSEYLVTSSSDYTVKVWNVPQQSGDMISEEESDVLLICTLQHPSFAYAGVFLMDTKMPVIATACFDSRMRIWQFDAQQQLQILDETLQQEIISYDGLSFDQFDNLGNHRHPNCIVYDGAKCLFVGDSLGSIHFYDINLSGGSYIARRLSLIQVQEIVGNPINCISLMPPEQQDLLVHTRDNCIRVIDFKTSENKFQDAEVIYGSVNNRFFGSLSQKIACKSVSSPKGDYVLSGSEDGKPHLWSNLTQTLPTDVFQFNVIGPIADVAWNQGYHMIAIAGFGDEHPIVVYVWERLDDLNFIEAKKLQDQMKFADRVQDDIVFNIQAKAPIPQSRFQQSLQAQGLFQPQLAYAQPTSSVPGPFGNTGGIGRQPQFSQTQPSNIGGPFGQQVQSTLPFGQQVQSTLPFGQSGGPFAQQSNVGGPFMQQQQSNIGGPFAAQSSIPFAPSQQQSNIPAQQMPFGQQQPFGQPVPAQSPMNRQQNGLPFQVPPQQVPPNHPNTPFNNSQMPFK